MTAPAPFLISVVTPSFNQGAYIEQTIKSVLGQNYSFFEHLVMDGGSSDNTVEVLRRYPHLQWKSERDNGQSAALNKALAIAKGEIVAWINADDFYEPNVFGTIGEFFRANPGKNVVMGDCNLLDETGRIFDKIINRERGFDQLKKYWVGKSIPTQPAIFFRRKLLQQHGLLDETLHYAMDYDLWMRFARDNYFHHLDIVAANYRFHSKAKGGSGDWSKFEPEWKLVHDRYVVRSFFQTMVKKAVAALK